MESGFELRQPDFRVMTISSKGIKINEMLTDLFIDYYYRKQYEEKHWLK